MGDRRSECPFGSSCYRRNPHHFREHTHRHLASLLASHPSISLPPSTSRPSTITAEALEQQLTLYRDVERSLAKGTEPIMGAPHKTKTPPQTTISSKQKPFPKPESKKPPTKASTKSPEPSRTSNLHSQLFDDDGEADLEDALKRSLEDQGGGSNRGGVGAERSRVEVKASSKTKIPPQTMQGCHWCRYIDKCVDISINAEISR